MWTDDASTPWAEGSPVARKIKAKKEKLDQRAVPNLFNLISQKYFKGSVWRLTIIFCKGIKKIIKI